MRTPEPQLDVLVLGAGMAGLTAATALQRAGRRVLVLDKGRGVGGRMASRRIGDATFDHGAQFITARDARFVAAMEEWQQLGVVEEWCRGFSGQADGHPRWRGKPTMTSVTKHLAQGVEILTEKQVSALRRSHDGWDVETVSGESMHARAVVLTPPVPQSLALLDAGKVPFAAEERARLTRIEYTRCLAVMAMLTGPSRLPPPGALSPADGPIVWIADNQAKGISSEPAITIHASHAFSMEHWERDRQESGRLLLDAAKEWLGAEVKLFQVQGWRYSKPICVDERRCAIISETPPLVLAGDAFAGPRVEGAALSGWAAAEAILHRAAR